VNKNNELKKQKIICLEWVSPFYIAGHWVHEMIEILDGNNGLAKKGDTSKIISINKIIEFDPDRIIIMPCGFSINRILKEVKILNNDIEWNLLNAVKMSEVYLVDANSYFSKPSPRIVIGLEVLAKILHPYLFKDLKVPNDSYKKMTK
jgi:iron complex transport system substrate-binding protein